MYIINVFFISKNTWHSILWVLATPGMLKESKIWEVNLTISTISCFWWMFCVFTNFSGIHSYFFFKWKDHKIFCFEISKKKIVESVNLTLCVLRLLPPHVSLSVLLTLLMNYYNITDVENCKQGLWRAVDRTSVIRSEWSVTVT